MIRHHLTDALLLGYAAGTLPEAFSLLAAAHVSLCDECRARLGSFEVLGGTILDGDVGVDGGAVAMTAGPEACLTRPVTAAPISARTGILPGPLADYVGGGVGAVKWRPLGMGVRQAILKTARSNSARLLYIPAGVAVPEHGHRGLELTLVLQGAFRDATDHFGPGDVEIADAGLQHVPTAEPGLDCVCLAATDAPLRFKDLLPRLLQPLFRI